MALNQPILVARDIYKDYFLDRNKVSVLKGVDFEVSEGQIVAIVGPSGVGKSTLLHILGTLDRPSKGYLRIDNTDVLEFEEQRLAWFRNHTIGFVFQFHHLLPEFTALENVMMPGLISGQSKQRLNKRAKSLLNDVGLAKRLYHRPGELSGGEQQRVAVARALMQNPKIILADEPSGNLDEASSQSLHNLLWRLSRKDNRTFVIVTHNNELAERSDKIVELLDGCIKKERVNKVA